MLAQPAEFNTSIQGEAVCAWPHGMPRFGIAIYFLKYSYQYNTMFMTVVINVLKYMIYYDIGLYLYPTI